MNNPDMERTAKKMFAAVAAGGCGVVIVTVVLNLLALGAFVWFVVWLLRALEVIS